MLQSRQDVTDCPLHRREEGYDRYGRAEEYYRRRDDPYLSRYRDHLDRTALSTEGQCQAKPFFAVFLSVSGGGEVGGEEFWAGSQEGAWP